MPDPFQEKHKKDADAERKKAQEDAAKQYKIGVAQRVAATAAAKAKPEKPNSDLGYKWRPKFWEPGY